MEAKLGEPVLVAEFAVRGRFVELEIACMYDEPLVGLDRESGGIDDRMSHANGFDNERPHLELLAGPGLEQPRVREHLVLVRSSPKQAERVGRSPNRDIVLAQEVRQSSDVVLVGMGDEDPGDTASKRFERAEVGMDDVDPEPATVESHPTVDEEDPAALLERQAVHADLTEAPERADAQAAARFGAHSGRL